MLTLISNVLRTVPSLLLTLLLSTSAWGQTPKLSIQWLGGPTAIIHFNGVSLITDPMLGTGERAFWMADPNENFDLQQGPNERFFKRLTQLPPVDISRLDAVLLSHAHEDHFDQQAQQVLAKTVPIYLPATDAKKVASYGFQTLLPLKAGDNKHIQAKQGSITIIAIPADHSANPKLEPLLGQGLGYVMVFRQGDWSKTLYWSGDSLPTSKVIQALEQQPDIDIALLNMGAVGTPGPLGLISMDAQQALIMSKAIKAKKIIPIHHSTFDLYLEPISDFLVLAEQQGISVDVISEGSALTYP